MKIKIQFSRFGDEWRVYQVSDEVIEIGKLVPDMGSYRFEPEKLTVYGSYALEQIGKKLKELNQTEGSNEN